MEEIIKEILFKIALYSGTICIILVAIVGLYRTFCFTLDNMKGAPILHKCLYLYIKRNRPDIKMELDKIKFKDENE